MEKMMTANGIEIPAKFSTYVKFPLDNVTSNWVYLTELDTTFEHKWSSDLVLDDEVGAAMKAMGFNVRDLTDKSGNVTKNVLKVVKKEKNKDGSLNPQPLVVGPDGKTTFTARIGNGSVLNYKLTAKAWKVKGQWSLSCYLDAAQVVTLVEPPSSFGDTTGAATGVQF